MTTKKQHKIIFWGATGHARALHEAIIGSKFKLVALVDSRPIKSCLDGIKIINGMRELNDWLKQSRSVHHFAVAVSDTHDRLMLMDVLTQRNLTPCTIIHRTAFVAQDAKLGDGCQIMAQAAVCSHSSLGSAVIVNTAASIDHNCKIADGVHIGPGARIASESTIGACALIGIGALILPHTNVGENAIVGAGAIVTRDVAANTTVIGAPAQPVSFNKSEH